MGKVSLKRTNAIIDYNVQSDEKYKMDKLLKFINENLSAEMITFGTTTISDDP